MSGLVEYNPAAWLAGTDDGQRYARFVKGLHSCEVSFSDDSEQIETDDVAKILKDHTLLADSNSVGSRVDRGLGGYVGHTHKPVLDLDMDALLLPSSTPGHHHLYIDKEMPWHEYSLMLNVLAHVGILQPGYVRASHARAESFLRVPWVTK